MRSWDSSPHSPPSSKYNLIPAVREVYCTGEVGAVWFHCLPTASVGDFQLKLQSSRVFKQQRVCNRRTLQKWKRPLLLLFHCALQEVCAKTVIPARGDTLKVHQKKRLLWGRIYQVWSQRWVLLFFFFCKSCDTFVKWTSLSFFGKSTLKSFIQIFCIFVWRESLTCQHACSWASEAAVLGWPVLAPFWSELWGTSWVFDSTSDLSSLALGDCLNVKSAVCPRGFKMVNVTLVPSSLLDLIWNMRMC